jgi:hypothetical protein
MRQKLTRKRGFPASFAPSTMTIFSSFLFLNIIYRVARHERSESRGWYNATNPAIRCAHGRLREYGVLGEEKNYINNEIKNKTPTPINPENANILNSSENVFV